MSHWVSDMLSLSWSSWEGQQWGPGGGVRNGKEGEEENYCLFTHKIILAWITSYSCCRDQRIYV